MTRAYLDPSALVKLVLEEAESRQLASFLTGRAPVTSAVASVEVPRAALGATGRGRPFRRALDLVAGCEQLALDDATRQLAATLEPPALRALDAIHLASALRVQDLVDVFVTYDRRLAAAARDAGFEVASPGRD